MHALESIPKVGPSLAEALRAAGFSTVDEVASATPDDLVVVRGIGPANAPQLIEAARAVQAQSDAEPPLARPSEAVNEAVDSVRKSASFLSEDDRHRLMHRLERLRKRAKRARKKSKAKSGAKAKKLRAEAKKWEKKARKLERKLS